VLIASCGVLAAASISMSTLWALEMITPERLVGLGLVMGVGVAFFNPAWQAIVPSLVPSSLVPGAVSLNSATAGMATALGPAVGGVLVASVGPGWSFATATIGYVTILVTTVTAKTLKWDKDRASMGVAIATGLRYLRFSHGYLSLLLLGCLFGFASAALRSMLPNLTKDVLGGDSTLYGTLLGLFGAGALVGGLSRSLASRGFGRRLIPACILLFGAMGVVVGASRLLLLTAVAIALSGLLWTWILSTLISTYQMLTPDWVRGRTMSAFTLSVFGFLPLGAIASGALGDNIGADHSIIAFSLIVVGIGVFAFRMPLPVLESIDPPILRPPSADDLSNGEGRPEPVMVMNTWIIDETEFDDLVELLAELRRLRLRTGAYQWAVYRSASNLERISEVFMLHSWDQHLQQHRRLDLQALETIAEMDRIGPPETLVREHLVAFDVDQPSKHPAWSDLVIEHEQLHRPHMDRHKQ
jgi:MFS family permease